MRHYRKIVGPRLYLSPFDGDNGEMRTKWAEWMNDRAVGDHDGGHSNLVSLASAKKTLEELSGYRFDIIRLGCDAFMGVFIGERKQRGKGCGAGIACHKKVGFRQAGRRREWIYKDGKYIDKIYMERLAREFEGAVLCTKWAIYGKLSNIVHTSFK